MNLTPAQKQLANLSLKSVMGASGQEDDFSDRINDLASRIWSEFIDEEITHLLTDEQLVQLGVLLQDEETTEEEFSDFLNDAVAGFDEMYQEKVLDNKAVIVEGRIKQLRVLTAGETELELLLDDCEDLIEKGEWLEVQDILVKYFADF